MQSFLGRKANKQKSWQWPRVFKERESNQGTYDSETET